MAEEKRQGNGRRREGLGREGGGREEGGRREGGSKDGGRGQCGGSRGEMRVAASLCVMVYTHTWTLEL